MSEHRSVQVHGRTRFARVHRPGRGLPIVGRLAVDDNGLRYYLPRGFSGFVLLSETGRMVYWTGRVAIGLRA